MIARTRASRPLACACKVEDQSKRSGDGSRDADARRCIARCASLPRDFRLVHANQGSIALRSSAPGDTEGPNCEIENFARRCDQLFNNGDLGGTVSDLCDAALLPTLLRYYGALHACVRSVFFFFFFFFYSCSFFSPWLCIAV